MASDQELVGLIAEVVRQQEQLQRLKERLEKLLRESGERLADADAALQTSQQITRQRVGPRSQRRNSN